MSFRVAHEAGARCAEEIILKRTEKETDQMIIIQLIGLTINQSIDWTHYQQIGGTDMFQVLFESYVARHFANQQENKISQYMEILAEQCKKINSSWNDAFRRLRRNSSFLHFAIFRVLFHAANVQDVIASD
jgi:hypothetical protein